MNILPDRGVEPRPSRIRQDKLESEKSWKMISILEQWAEERSDDPPNRWTNLDEVIMSRDKIYKNYSQIGRSID